MVGMVQGQEMEEGLSMDAGAQAAPAGCGQNIIYPVGKTTGVVPMLQSLKGMDRRQQRQFLPSMGLALRYLI